MSAEWIIVATPLITLAAWGLFLRRGGRAPGDEAPHQTRRVRINGSYQPAELHVRAGEPARLIFRREETAPCSERVVFPDYGISVMLPPFQDVAVHLPASEPGQHEFTCEMRMLHGTLIVDGAEHPARVGRRVVAR